MKKLFISSIFVFTAATMSVNATTLNNRLDDGKENISSSVLQHFGYTFYRASNVSWNSNKNFQKATFVLDGKKSYAIYDTDNNFVVATQIAVLEDLPEKVKSDMTKEYTGIKSLQILKVISRPANFQLEDDTNAYWIDFETPKEHIIAISFPSSSLTIVKKEDI